MRGKKLQESQSYGRLRGNGTSTVAYNQQKRREEILRAVIQIFKVIILNKANESETVHLHENVTVHM